MSWLNDFIKNKPHIVISLPILTSAASFFGNLFIALSDGHLDSAEFHQLLGSANGIESLILIIIFIALKEKKK